jgi:hypothetical protein
MSAIDVSCYLGLVAMWMWIFKRKVMKRQTLRYSTQPVIVLFWSLVLAISVKAESFTFTFTNSQNVAGEEVGIAGTVTGTLTLPDICSISCAATDATITSVPPAASSTVYVSGRFYTVESSIESIYGNTPFDLFQFFGNSYMLGNRFTESNGVITGGGLAFDDYTNYSIEHIFSLSVNGVSNFGYAENLVFGNAENRVGFTVLGVPTFSSAGDTTSAVPEPASWILIEIGLIGVAWLKIRAKA